ncbi:hypothetical protein GCM10007242_45330 [Pigmentiphaga litoralis]|uniref:hypothetical protein n=1 Tax=Pigmentiphaga litoralis TaxID=516702 RepID=UPI00167BF90A|nr:hypothetical protein [Pigmentiphaga litoralis]GGX33172.1 hypothetical protein GCM10007242_45330 [Pigmentiphaga litoralis]
MQFDVRSNIDAEARRLSDIERRHVPFATARGLTMTAQDVKAAERQEMERKLDRPTPYTLNSLYVRPATKTALAARVWIKDEAGKGTPANRFVGPNIEGGGRNAKRFERALQTTGLMPREWRAVPAAAAQIDRFGNMAASQIRMLLSYFQSAELRAGYSGNMTARRKAAIGAGSVKKGTRGVVYFVSYGKGQRRGAGSWMNGREQNLPAGIWQRTSFGTLGTSVKPVVLFVRRAQYQQRLDFYGVAQRVSAERFESNFKTALDAAVGRA